MIEIPYGEEFLLRKKQKLQKVFEEKKKIEERDIDLVVQEVRSELDAMNLNFSSSKQEIAEAIEQFEKPFAEKLKKIQEEVHILLLGKQRNEATETIVKFLEKERFIYTTKDDIKSEMWIYASGIYLPNGESELRRIIREILGVAYTTYLVNEIINKIKADTYIEVENLFNASDKNIIPLRNGLLNLQTFELQSYTPQKIFFSKIPLIYAPNIKCPRIEQFFKDILRNEEDIKVIYELFGYTLLKENKFEKAFMFVGNGRNGKSKTLELLKKFIGTENTCSVPLQSMTHDNSALCELFNRFLNIAGDLNNEDFKDTGMFKQITGRDTIQARRKFLRDLIFTPFVKNIFSCNELPKVYDISDGFWERWVLLEYPFKFVTKEVLDTLNNSEKNLHKLKDDDILEKITTEEELSGLLNESLEGLKRLLENKTFSTTKGTKEVKDFWIRKSNSLLAFCLDTIEENYESHISKKEFRKTYGDYCKKHHIKPLSDVIIKRILEENYNVTESKKEILNSQIHIWEGIKFKMGVSRNI